MDWLHSLRCGEDRIFVSNLNITSVSRSIAAMIGLWSPLQIAAIGGAADTVTHYGGMFKST
jgi:hypothetical protein